MNLDFSRTARSLTAEAFRQTITSVSRNLTRAGFLAVCAAGAVAIAERHLWLDSTQPSTVSRSHARALALRALAFVRNSNDPDVLSYRARAISALRGDANPVLDQLWQGRQQNGGYGLPYAWDAFSDGTTNPQSTLYTYTTATAALSYLDNGRPDRARQLVSAIFTRCWSEEHGCVWYSDQPADQRSRTQIVPNVNALALVAATRLGYEPSKQARIRQILARTAKNGAWPYRLGAEGLNDLEHHSFMVEGVLTARMTEAPAAVARLADFFHSDGSFDSHSEKVMGSERWGPGDGLAQLVHARHPLAHRVAAVIAASIEPDGVSTFADRDEPRSVVRYGYGLAKYAAAKT